jgi:uncharacterized membrane protein YvbJ
MYCPQCGTQNNDNNFKCTSCGQILHPEPKIVVETGDNVLATIIPYKNTSALIAYYLGVFSIIPCIGIILGIAAFILGLKGLSFAKKHPEVKGKVHAWIGIIVGGFFGILYLILTISMLSIGLFHK